MKVIECEICGSQNIVKQNGMYVCQSCGTKYDLEEAKKLLVDVSNSIEIENTNKELDHYYQLLKQAFDEKHYLKVEDYYNEIIKENPNDWEASFYYYISKILDSSFGDYTRQCVWELIDHYDPIITTMKHSVDYSRRNAVCKRMYEAISNAADSIHKAAKNNWLAKDGVKDGYEYGRITYYDMGILDATNLLEKFGDKVDEIFDGEMHVLSVAAWKEAINHVGDCYNICHQKEIVPARKKDMQDLEEKIQQYEIDYKLPEDSSFDTGLKDSLTTLKESVKQPGGCYVATAVYGSYDCPQVWTLRRYRDYTLAETWYGRAFIHTYYAISPKIIKWFGETEWFKNMWKPKLDRMVKALNEKGVADTPYKDRKW